MRVTGYSVRWCPPVVICWGTVLVHHCSYYYSIRRPLVQMEPSVSLADKWSGGGVVGKKRRVSHATIYCIVNSVQAVMFTLINYYLLVIYLYIGWWDLFQASHAMYRLTIGLQRSGYKILWWMMGCKMYMCTRRTNMTKTTRRKTSRTRSKEQRDSRQACGTGDACARRGSRNGFVRACVRQNGRREQPGAHLPAPLHAMLDYSFRGKWGLAGRRNRIRFDPISRRQ